MAGNIVTPQMVADICNSGMMGSIPSGYLTLTNLRTFIKETQRLTSNDFIVNIFIEPDHPVAGKLAKPHAVRNIEVKLGLPDEDSFIYPVSVPLMDYVDLLIAMQVRYVSTTFGFFNSEIVTKLKAKNIIILATVTSPAEARFCIANGADGLILQGQEAGGHQGYFLTNQCGRLSTLELLDSVSRLDLGVPLIVAGGIGINDIPKFLSAGAQLIQLGSLFMLTETSGLPHTVKEYICKCTNTSFTKDITGQYARGVTNLLMSELVNTLNYTFPIQHYATSRLRKYARDNLLTNYMALWVGKHANLEYNSLNVLLEKIKASCLNYQRCQSSVIIEEH